MDFSFSFFLESRLVVRRLRLLFAYFVLVRMFPVGKPPYLGILCHFFLYCGILYGVVHC